MNKHRGPFGIALVIWVGLALACCRSTLAQAQGAEIGVALHPMAVHLSQGETVEVVVEVTNATDVFGAEVSLGFDPAHLQVVDADTTTEGIQLRSGAFLPAEDGFIVANRADNGSGTALYALTLLSPAVPSFGQGDLVTVVFRAVSEGEAYVTLEDVVLASPRGTALPVDVDRSSLPIYVVGEGEGVVSESPVMGAIAPIEKAELPIRADIVIALGLSTLTLLGLGLGLIVVLRRKRR
ncbi:MAG: hypothetical protein JXA14_17120 [Anaerolineae bacterium]|nr:hypothetical protein [Anaerolineae bacterium]